LKKISIIVAVSSNGIIGKNGTLPWHIPMDLNHFKEYTLNTSVIMGRHCYHSIGNPLPNRENIVVSHQNISIEGCIVVSSIEKAIEVATKSEIFIIGGGQIYEKAFQYASEIQMTKIFGQHEGDVYLNGFNLNDWMLDATSEPKFENGFCFQFQKYIKKSLHN
jgi:dihydrofolate reductase